MTIPQEILIPQNQPRDLSQPEWSVNKRPLMNLKNYD